MIKTSRRHGTTLTLLCLPMRGQRECHLAASSAELLISNWKSLGDFYEASYVRDRVDLGAYAGRHWRCERRGADQGALAASATANIVDYNVGAFTAIFGDNEIDEHAF